MTAASLPSRQERRGRRIPIRICRRCRRSAAGATRLAVFLNQPRSWDRWNDVFADMTQRGANGTDEQLARVTTYFLENLTLVNVNSSPADELAWVLGVNDDVAQAIIARREHQPFADIAQLRAVPGVDAAKLENERAAFFSDRSATAPVALLRRDPPA